MATLENLQAKISKLRTQAEAIAKKETSAVIAKIRDLMEKHGLTTADIGSRIGGAKKRGPKPEAKPAARSSASAAKYRDPKSGATWTGHGRAPAWIANAKDRSKFLTEGTAVVSAPAIKKPAKAGGYVRGPQPALYADPKTGATWSGRGRAPAWLAGAKDRSKFLADGAAPKAVSVGQKAAKAGNYIRGPQAPKYKDPKTGATWSGRGPAPAWLAAAKDRSKFLFVEAAAPASTVKAKTQKAAPAKKAATKPAAKKAPETEKTLAKNAAAKKAAAKSTAPQERASTAASTDAKKATVKKAATKSVSSKRAVQKPAARVEAPVVDTTATSVGAPAVSADAVGVTA
ncbi:H-NS family nucleoid-associated regulatory protein [Paraburkholderia sp. BR13444]|uniref:H-NS family nucleoid-associated regulatory protein n=1 Tax=Paraburkholderia sp. BR13444 TaxID=3236997 RepID=UPI0034CD3D65